MEVLLDEIGQPEFEGDEDKVMSSAIQVVKREDREASARTADGSRVEKCGTREIVRTVKTWIVESRDRRQAQAKLAVQFLRGPDVKSGFEPLEQTAKSCLTTLFVVGLIVLSARGAARAVTFAVN